jgi:hypothetical protein
VARLRFVTAFNITKAQLYRLIAIGLQRFHLSDDTRTSLDDRDWYHSPVFTEDLSHPYFFSQESLEHFW